MSTSTEVSGRRQWVQTCNEQGWNSDSQLIHLEGFLAQKGLFAEFAEYARQCALEENAEARHAFGEDR